MRRTLTIALAAAALFALGHLASRSDAGAARAIAAQPVSDPRIAVVDISVVIDNLDEQKVLQSQLQSIIDDANADLEQAERRLTTLRSDLDMLGPGTEEHTRKSFQVREAEGTLRLKRETLRGIISDRTGSLLLRLYGKVKDAVQDLARRDGYDLVLINDSGVDIPPRGNQEQVLGFIQSRRVLFASERIDITDEVARFMNNRFNAGANP